MYTPDTRRQTPDVTSKEAGGAHQTDDGNTFAGSAPDGRDEVLMMFWAARKQCVGGRVWLERNRSGIMQAPDASKLLITRLRVDCEKCGSRVAVGGILEDEGTEMGPG